MAVKARLQVRGKLCTDHLFWSKQLAGYLWARQRCTIRPDCEHHNMLMAEYVFSWKATISDNSVYVLAYRSTHLGLYDKIKNIYTRTPTHENDVPCTGSGVGTGHSSGRYSAWSAGVYLLGRAARRQGLHQSSHYHLSWGSNRQAVHR